MVNKNGLVLFRCSGVGNLMVGAGGITDKQLATIAKHEARAANALAGTEKPLTDVMRAELSELIAKRDAPFQLSETAKSFVEETWLQDTFQYKDLLNADQIQKGNECEAQAMAALSKVLPCGAVRIANTRQMENDWLCGKYDFLTPPPKFVEDIKVSFTVKSYISVEKPNPLYYGQIQGYMDLAGAKQGRLIHYLADTPQRIVNNMLRRLAWSFEGGVDSYEYQEQSKQLIHNHTPSLYLSPKERLKYFEFDRDDHYISELKFRINEARKYYATLKVAYGRMDRD